MALTFPLALSDFWDLFPKQSAKFEIKDNITMSGLGSGEVLRGEIAPAYWEANVTFAAMSLADARQCRAMIESMRSGIGTFNAYDPIAAYPADDPKGSILGSADITVIATSGLNLVKLGGFEPGYKINIGDMFSFTYGTGQIYRALHRFTETAWTNDAGEFPLLKEVRPFFADAPAIGKGVQLKKPVCKMAIIPGSYSPGEERQMVVSGISFKCRQVP